MFANTYNPTRSKSQGRYAERRNPKRRVAGDQQRFFQELLGRVSDDHFIELRRIHRETGKVDSEFFDNLELFYRAATKQQEEGWDYYFGVNPRNAAAGKNENVEIATCFYTDRDFKNFRGGQAEAEEALSFFPLKPTVTVFTGHGYQDYFFLKKPVRLSENTDYRPVLKGVQNALGSDSIDDPARILRVPGTINYKNPDDPILSQIVAADYSRRYMLDDFVRIIPNLPKRVGSSETAVREKIQTGTRNNTLFKNGCSLRAKGFTQSEIEAKLLAINAQSCNPSLEETEVTRIAGSAAKYPAGTPAMDIGLVRELADAISAKDHFAQDLGRSLYVFERGAYRTGGEERVRRQVQSLLENWGRSKKWSSKCAQEVIEYIRVRSPLLWELPPLDVLNLKNGLLDLNTLNLLPHMPEHLSAIQLPVAYDPTANCPEWKKFVAAVFPKDSIDVAWQVVAWLMRPDNSLQKALLLIGDGANGKSRFLAGLLAFLGEANTTSIALQRLENDRFAPAHLMGKLANICSDLPSARIEGTTMFKGVTGCDRIHAERKFQEGFDFKPFSRLVFSANYMPRSADSDEAYYRRWVVVPFPHTFKSADPGFIPSEELDRRLSDPTELSGLLNLALHAFARTKAARITVSASMEQAAKDFRSTTNPVSLWLDTETKSGTTLSISKDQLYLPICTKGSWWVRICSYTNCSVVPSFCAVSATVRRISIGFCLLFSGCINTEIICAFSDSKATCC